MSNWKVFGIRVPAESDLPDRFKEISEKARITYGELLEKLLAQFDGLESELTPRLEATAGKMFDLERQIEQLKKQIEDFEQAQDHGLAVSQPPSITLNTESVSVSRMILDLHAAGHSLRSIAHKFNEENVPTPPATRSGKWSHSLVDRILKRGIIAGNPG